MARAVSSGKFQIVTEYPLARSGEDGMLLAVKDLRQEQHRVYFRLPAKELREFNTLCRGHYGSYQNVLEKFAVYFMRMDPANRDALFRKMVAATPTRLADPEPEAAPVLKGWRRRLPPGPGGLQ